MNLFSFIKERVSIFDVVSEYVTLKKAGGYYKGTCLFHHEKTASFTVSPDKDIFYCFGCHVSGDVISFIAKVENCSQKSAAQLIAEKYQITIPSHLSFELSEKNIEEKNHYFTICKAFALWAHEQLNKNHLAEEYLKNRGFNENHGNYFTLGYFPGGTSSINDLLYSMKKQSILAKDLCNAHILASGKTTLYSPFEERLIFPIKDILGRFCGFGGRIFKSHDIRPKYYNSRENEYFIKGSLVFNLDQAKKTIQETGNVFLVEGYTDCMAMVQHGFINTVATLGTACTIEHLKQLSRYAEYLFIVYDGDNAGQQAILRLTDLCWQVNLELRVIVLPKGEDPASFLLKGNNMHDLINKAQDIFLFFINALGENFINKPLNQKIQTIRSFLTVLATISDPLKKDILLQKATKTFDIPFESLKEELILITQKTSTISPSSLPSKQDNQQQNTPVLSSLEKRIFCAIMNNMQLFKGAAKEQLIVYFTPPLREIVTKLAHMTESFSLPLTFKQFFDVLNDNEKHMVSTLLFEENDILDETTFDKLLIQLQKKQWKNIVHDIKIQLTQAKQENNTEKVSLILHDFLVLQNKILHHNSQTIPTNDTKNSIKEGKNDKNQTSS